MATQDIDHIDCVLEGEDLEQLEQDVALEASQLEEVQVPQTKGTEDSNKSSWHPSRGNSSHSRQETVTVTRKSYVSRHPTYETTTQVINRSPQKYVSTVHTTESKPIVTHVAAYPDQFSPKKSIIHSQIVNTGPVMVSTSRRVSPHHVTRRSIIQAVGYEAPVTTTAKRYVSPPYVNQTPYHHYQNPVVLHNASPQQMVHPQVVRSPKTITPIRRSSQHQVLTTQRPVMNPASPVRYAVYQEPVQVAPVTQVIHQEPMVVHQPQHQEVVYTQTNIARANCGHGPQIQGLQREKLELIQQRNQLHDLLVERDRELVAYRGQNRFSQQHQDNSEYIHELNRLKGILRKRDHLIGQLQRDLQVRNQGSIEIINQSHRVRELEAHIRQQNHEIKELRSRLHQTKNTSHYKAHIHQLTDQIHEYRNELNRLKGILHKRDERIRRYQQQPRQHQQQYVVGSPVRGMVVHQQQPVHHQEVVVAQPRREVVYSPQRQVIRHQQSTHNLQQTIVSPSRPQHHQVVHHQVTSPQHVAYSPPRHQYVQQNRHPVQATTQMKRSRLPHSPSHGNIRVSRAPVGRSSILVQPSQVHQHVVTSPQRVSQVARRGSQVVYTPYKQHH